MANIPGKEVAINTSLLILHVIGCEGLLDGFEQLVELRSVTDCYIVNLVGWASFGFWIPAFAGMTKQHGAIAVIQVADVAFDEIKIGPLFGDNQALYFFEIMLVAGREIIQPDHALIQLEQRF